MQRRSTATAQRMRRVTYWTCILILMAAGIGGAGYGVREGMKRTESSTAASRASRVYTTAWCCS